MGLRIDGKKPLKHYNMSIIMEEFICVQQQLIRQKIFILEEL